MPQCGQCNENVSLRDKVCSFCGTPSPQYQPPIDEVNDMLERGMHAFQQQNYALAVECYRQAIARDPDVFSAYFYLASCYSELGREKEAVEAMEKAQRIRPGSSVIDYNLGLLYKRMGQAAEARRHLESALRKVGGDVALENRQHMRQTIENELTQLGLS